MFASHRFGIQLSRSFPKQSTVIKMGNNLTQYACGLACGASSTVENYSKCDYLVIGGGNAAGYLAKAFAEEGVKPGKLMIISEETVMPYERPALSKAFLTNDQVRLPGFHTCVGSGGDRQDETWYADNKIPVVTGCKATEIDLDKKTVHTEGGRSFGYKKLVLATGADAARLRCEGADLLGVHYLRSHDDGLRLVTGMDMALQSQSKQAVVIGGGYIGMETAAALSTVGLSVTMVFPEQWALSRIMPKPLAKFYEDYYKQRGIKFVKSSALVSSFKGENGKLSGVELANGAVVPADLAVVGVGALPRSELVREKLTMSSGGIVVDGRFQTSAPDVYAIGDIAHFPLKKYGRSQRMEHVAHARASAAHCVKSILHPDETPDYDYLPYFYSRVFGLAWKFYGDNIGEVVIVGSMKPFLLALWIREEVDAKGRRQVNGVFLESGGDPKYDELIRKVAQMQPMISKQQLSKLTFWGAKVPGAMEVLEELIQPPGVTGVINSSL